MKLPTTRRLFLSSLPLSLPAWLSPIEQSLIKQVMHSNEGISLHELERTNFERIRRAVGDAQVVLIGEATHGTEEFYRIRAELTKELLADGFEAVLCEADFPPMFELNRFVGGAHASHRKMAPTTITVDLAMAGFRDHFPEWMWCNNAVREFVLWLQKFNARRCESSGSIVCLPVQLLGLDVYSLFQSIDQVMDYLIDAGELQLAKQVRRCYSTLDNFRPDPQEYSLTVSHGAVRSQADQVTRVLTSLFKSKNRLYQIPGNGQELFNAMENARVVAAVEAYYRQMYLDKEKLWNLRDSSFLDAIVDTISYLRKRKLELGMNEDVRVVVWAHNSHVGDARATDAASRGQHKIGQLCRQVYGKDNVYIVGFSSNDGTVRAAKRWGAPGEVNKLNPAFEGSHEYLLHLLSRNRRQNSFGYTLRSNSQGANVDRTARELFKMDRVERFVGVSYIPATEMQSHYSVCSLSDQFDFILHVDRSTALRVDHATGASTENGRVKTNSAKWDMLLLDELGEDYKALYDKNVEEAT